MDGKNAFKRGPQNTLKILISVLKHCTLHITVRLLRGVAWNELLIRRPSSPPASHPDFMGVGVGWGVC
jgi:hypothetical protein